ncbi:MAG: histidine phosphatase family protein [Burkholderiales bacterium]|nr:histidine phosphatase family protein [Burkholderiales bacterium]MDE2075904.1 histidine phosphatase family protein [Burkholderiales bacterium]MDE2431822.1 histidine phosphatase family protein [Burkholderiales bacterium]
MGALVIHVWRHPRPMGAAGRCIGQSELPVDRRKVKRLAHRIRSQARRHRWPRVIYTSALGRSREVGRCLARWGWRHVVDPLLNEASFGAWDGLRWDQIDPGLIDAWVKDFAGFHPGRGESLTEVLRRARTWCPAHDASSDLVLVVGHGGWMLARQWGQRHPSPPVAASEWPAPPRYGECWRLE